MSILNHEKREAFEDELKKIANGAIDSSEPYGEEEDEVDSEGVNEYVYHSGAPIRIRNNKRMKNELASIRRKRSFLRRDE